MSDNCGSLTRVREGVHCDGKVGKNDPRVGSRDERVVPVRDRALDNADEYRTGQGDGSRGRKVGRHVERTGANRDRFDPSNLCNERASRVDREQPEISRVFETRKIHAGRRAGSHGYLEVGIEVCEVDECAAEGGLKRGSDQGRECDAVERHRAERCRGLIGCYGRARHLSGRCPTGGKCNRNYRNERTQNTSSVMGWHVEPPCRSQQLDLRILTVEFGAQFDGVIKGWN